MHARTLPLGLLALALAACRGGGSSLDADNSKVGVSPLALGFGSVYLQATPVQSFTVFNAGGGVDSVGLSLIADGGSGFTLDAGGFPLSGGGSVQVAVGFTPALAGPSTAEVRVAWSNGFAEVALTGNGLAWPSCEPKGACASAAFDPNTGSCNQSPLADGAPCDGGVLCLQNTQCPGRRVPRPALGLRRRQRLRHAGLRRGRRLRVPGRQRSLPGDRPVPDLLLRPGEGLPFEHRPGRHALRVD